MDRNVLDQQIEEYLERNWDQVVDDIAQLVAVPSVENEASAAPGAPFGQGPAQALETGLAIAQRMGFATTNMQGYIGIADFEGQSQTQLAIIGHTDVVPEGPGWTMEPYQLTRKDGYLLGRGTGDDKGPLVVAMHAVKFWMDRCQKLPYTVRVLLGANEETRMDDVRYYLRHQQPPAFLLTPDAGFPVSYGEKGIATFKLAANPQGPRRIVSLAGGSAVNAVPGIASAVVRDDGEGLPEAQGITLQRDDQGQLVVSASGKGAHASMPELGINAIGLLLGYLLDNGLCSEAERPFLQLVFEATQSTDGACFGLQTRDDDFGPLTMACGIIAMDDQGVISQTLDIRFPTTVVLEQMELAIGNRAKQAGASFETTMHKPTFLMDPKSSVVTALLDAWNEVTGRNDKAFTMGGGTYARMFPRAASFGPEDMQERPPEWVGTMHGPDEGVSEELLKQEFRVYVHTIDKLMKLDLDQLT